MNISPYFPFMETVKNYSWKNFQADFMAALTVAIIALPQSMAYAIIAGVHPKYGLYSAIIPPIISSLFGSSKFLIAGPTNAISMVVSSTLGSVVIAGTIANQLPEEQKIVLVFLLAFLVGIIQLVMGLAKFGSLVNFVSHSVVVGFTAGAGVLISFNQLKNFLGLNIPSTSEFIETLHQTFFHLPETNFFALSLGLFTILFIIFAKKISSKIPGALMAMIISGGIVAFFDLGSEGVKLIGNIPQTLPPLSGFSFDWEVVRIIFPSALAIAILGIVEAFSIAKSIANSSGERIVGNQEFIAQGLANIVAAFSSSIPGSGSFTRSAVNFGAGAKTRLAGVFSGGIVLLVLLLFASLARFIPIASLAGILMVIAYSMVDKKSFLLSYRATRADRLVLITTFLATIFLELEIAVYMGVILSLVLFLRKVSHPQVTKVVPRLGDNKFIHFQEDLGERVCPQITFFQIDGSLFFGAINELEERLYSLDSSNQGEKVIILRLRGVHLMDASGAHALEKFLNYCEKKGIKVIMTNVKPYIVKVLTNSGVINHLGKENIVNDTEEAIKLAISQYIDRSVCQRCSRKLFKEC